MSIHVLLHARPSARELHRGHAKRWDAFVSSTSRHFYGENFVSADFWTPGSSAFPSAITDARAG